MAYEKVIPESAVYRHTCVCTQYVFNNGKKHHATMTQM